MNVPYSFQVTHLERARQVARHVSLGRCFVFAHRSLSAIGGAHPLARHGRLLVGASAKDAPAVLPAVGAPVHLPGITVFPNTREPTRLGCVVADRDLYRAEEDVAYLLVSMPGYCGEARLVIHLNGQHLVDRRVEVGAHGLVVEALAGLLSGSYEVSLFLGTTRIGAPARFTVAEYTLAPLSARLLDHRLRGEGDSLEFSLFVESYQLPFEAPVIVALLDGETRIGGCTLRPTAPGRFDGTLPLRGQGPFRLRLNAEHDASRVAEVVVPGSRAAERQETVLNELGQEVRLSLMPQADALPMRGAWLTEGDHLNTPVTVEAVITPRGRLLLQADAQALCVLVRDGVTGRLREHPVPSLTRGSVIDLGDPGPLTTAFVGGWFGGQPFEGYASFMAPSRISVALEAPARLRPRDVLTVSVRQPSPEAGPLAVVLSVRDERLTSTDTPEVALAASLKAGLDQEVAPFRSGGDFMPLEDAARPLLHPPLPPPPQSFDYALPSPVPSSIREPLLPYARTAAAAPPGAAPARLQEAAAPRSRGRAQPSAEGGGGPPAVAQTRDSFPEQLYFGLLTCDGELTVNVPLGDNFGSLLVEAFVCQGADWMRVTHTVVVDQPVRADLDLPASVHRDDKVDAGLRVACESGLCLVRLSRDGAPVPLTDEKGRVVVGPVSAPAELRFPCQPGVYAAEVTDVATGALDRVSREVGEPGKLRQLRRQIRLLSQGERIRVDGDGVLSLRVLPEIGTPLKGVLNATADYGHLCCEQTAAKILSAVLLYLLDPVARPKAEEVILAGVAREERMFSPGRGFFMYPEQPHHSAHYSALAARHLARLGDLEGVPDLSTPLRQAVRRGLVMAEDAGRLHGISRHPEVITQPEDAYQLAVVAPHRAADCRRWVEGQVELSSGRVKDTRGAVERRRLWCWVAATLLASGAVAEGLLLANRALGELGPEGRLYSTVDSAALIALLAQMHRMHLLAGPARVYLNGVETDTRGLSGGDVLIDELEVVEGRVLVETTRIDTEDWQSFAGGVALKVGLRTTDGGNVRKLKAGTAVNLKVQLPGGYVNGDLLHVELPPGLAWIRGGGRVKRFTVDLAGRAEIDVPLVAVGDIDRVQHFAVCLRNMFEEERAGSPGLLKVGGGLLSFLS